MIGVGITAASAFVMILVATVLSAEVVIVILGSVAIIWLLCVGAIKLLSWLLSWVTHNEDTYPDPDPKPVKRRSF